jgi:hypothetical protein
MGCCRYNKSEETMSGALMRVAILTAIFMPLAAQAADREFCGGYTDAAIEQVNRAFSHPTCRGGARGPRWATDRRIHFEWCLGASPVAAAAEREARRDFLLGCGG